MKRFFLVLFPALCLTACISGRDSISSQVVIEANGYKLNAKQFASDLAAALRELDVISAKNPATVRRVKQDLARSFIEKSIVKSWAEQNKISANSDEIEEEISRVRSQYPDDLSFRQALVKEEMSFEDWKERVRYSVLQRKVFAVVAKDIPAPTDAEARAYYEEHKKDYQQKNQVRLRQIVVEREDDAERLYKEVTKSHNLPVLAKKFSIGPEKKKGGDLGWVEKGTLEVFDKAFSLNKGQYSKVLKSPYGFHIFEVVDKKAETQLNFNLVQDKILGVLRGDRSQSVYTKWLQSEIKRAKVMTNDKLLSSMSVETQGS